MRKVVFANNEIYHVFNRGVEKRPVFTDKREYARVCTTFDYYKYKDTKLKLSKALKLNQDLRSDYFNNMKDGKKLVEIICYCLMPNHFHFILKQKEDNGIKIFISNFVNSYTKYFNTKHKRNGPLFQGIFKAVRIEDDDQLIHVSRYIHLNPVVSYLIKEKELDNYLWSSFPEYLSYSQDKICDKDIVLDQFSSIKSYRKFVFDQIDYARELENIKHLILEK